MSGSSRRSCTDGYMLFEALVAVAVAGLVLSAFVQTHAVARKAARLPSNILDPSSVAQALMSDWLAASDRWVASGRRGIYAYQTEVAPVRWTPRAPRVAPGLAAAAPAPASTAARSYELRALEVRVASQEGRQLVRETIGVFATR
jgi:hypothetical protein